MRQMHSRLFWFVTDAELDGVLTVQGGGGGWVLGWNIIGFDLVVSHVIPFNENPDEFIQKATIQCAEMSSYSSAELKPPSLFGYCIRRDAIPHLDRTIARMIKHNKTAIDLWVSLVFDQASVLKTTRIGYAFFI